MINVLLRGWSRVRDRSRPLSPPLALLLHKRTWALLLGSASPKGPEWTPGPHRFQHRAPHCAQHRIALHGTIGARAQGKGKERAHREVRGHVFYPWCRSFPAASSLPLRAVPRAASEPWIDIVSVREAGPPHLPMHRARYVLHSQYAVRYAALPRRDLVQHREPFVAPPTP